MIKKTIFLFILIMSLPIMVQASFFDDLLKNIDNILNNKNTNSTTKIIPENNIQNTSNNNLLNTNDCFLTPLEIGNENNSVKKLQEFLSTLPGIYPEQLVTGYFGNLTKQAIIRFQLKYKNEILTPIGLIKPTGYVGQLTLNKLNQLNHCQQIVDKVDSINQNPKIVTNPIIDFSTTNFNNTPNSQPTNVSGIQTYQLTNPLGCNKYAWTTDCKNSYFICLTTFLNTQNINYSDLYVQPKNDISYSCTPQLTLLQADASYQDKLKTFGFSITNISIPKSEIADKYVCPQDIFINRLVYNQPTCSKLSNSFNSSVHYNDNILFKITNPGYGSASTQEKISTTDICDIKKNTCIQYQKGKHKLFDNEEDCLSYCSKQTKTLEVVDINAPCLVYPHTPYTNEPVFITSAYNPKKESRFWAPSMLYKYSSDNWKLDSNQSKNDILTFNFTDYGDKFLWKHNYDFLTTNAPSEQPYGLYGQKFFAFKKPGKYQYSFVDTKKSLTQQINFHYNCTINVEDNPEYKILFITDQLYPGDFQHLGPTKICNYHAKKLGYTTEFDALLSLDDLGANGDVYRLPKVYTDNSVADKTAKSLGLNYNGFYCDGSYWRFFASSYSVHGQAEASQFCAIPNFKWPNGWNSKWLSDLGKNTSHKGGYDHSNSFWYGKWFSFPGSDKALSRVNCKGFTSNSNKEEANLVFAPGAVFNGTANVLDRGNVTCDRQYPIACIEKTALNDQERKR